MTSLFADFPTEPKQPHRPKGATPGTPGQGPVGETCGTCKHCCRVTFHGRAYHKCDVIRERWSHGPGTDIRKKWAACQFFEAIEVSGV